MSSKKGFQPPTRRNPSPAPVRPATVSTAAPRPAIATPLPPRIEIKPGNLQKGRAALRPPSPLPPSPLPKGGPKRPSPNPPASPGAPVAGMGAPAGYAPSAPGYGSPAGYAPSAPGYGSPAGAMGTSSYPSGAMSTSPGIEPLLGRIAIALEQIVQVRRGGKRLFTLRKRKTRGRGKTRGRR
jgi:hypothetical protein